MTLPFFQPSPGSQRPRLLSQMLSEQHETTPLPLDGDAGFQQWLAANHVTDLDDPDSHYDYRGAYLADLQRSGNGHFPDTFKQHGHPTFSVESQYSQGDDDGGHWDGDRYVPAPAPATPGPGVAADPDGGDLSGLRDLMTQGAKGLANAGYDTAGGLADLLGATRVSDALHRSQNDMQAFYGNPRGTWGQVGAVGGNLVGQAALSAVPGAVAERAVAALPQAGMAARALARVLNPLGAEGGVAGAASKALGGAALDLPLAAGRAANARTSTLGQVADATGNATLQRMAGSFPARLLGEAATDVGGSLALQGAAKGLPAVAQDLKTRMADTRGAVGDLSQHPMDKALAAASGDLGHPVDNAVNTALDGLPVVYDPARGEASMPHHSTLQPRTPEGQFNGPPLSALHNTTLEGLQHADQLGGIPSPSMAVVTDQTPFTQFGDITMIGQQSHGDPTQSRVYSSDVYSPRQPDPMYSRLRGGRQDAAIDWINQFAPHQERDNALVPALDDILNTRHSNGPDPEKVLHQLSRSPAATARFLETQGATLPPAAEGLTANRNALDDLLDDHGGPAALRAWAEPQVRALVGDPSMMLGGRKVPYTLENANAAMTRSGKVRGMEDGTTSGPGLVAAANAKRFTDLEQMRSAAAANIVGPDAANMARKQVERVGGPYLLGINAAQHAADPNFRPSVWDAMNIAHTALAKSTTPSKLASALAREGLPNVPDDVLQQGIAYRQAITTAPVPYFEAKPARAVPLGEFAGALVPESQADQAGPLLAKYGVPMRTYPTSFDRASALQAFRAELAAKGAKTLFQLPAAAGAALLAKHGLTRDDVEGM